MNKQITNYVNYSLDYVKRSMASRLSESISFSDDVTTAGIWCLVWGSLIPEGIQETGGGPAQGYKDVESQTARDLQGEAEGNALVQSAEEETKWPSKSMTIGRLLER